MLLFQVTGVGGITACRCPACQDHVVLHAYLHVSKDPRVVPVPSLASRPQAVCCSHGWPPGHTLSPTFFYTLSPKNCKPTVRSATTHDMPRFARFEEISPFKRRIPERDADDAVAGSDAENADNAKFTSVLY